MTPEDHIRLARGLFPAIREAARVEMAFFRRGCDIRLKADSSPVTEADAAAEEIILKALRALAPETPVIAEEAVSRGEIPKTGKRFFLVDPLDGTKEFISESGDFTINVALVENAAPVFGLIHAPARKTLWLTPAPGRAATAALDPAAPLPAWEEPDLRAIGTAPPPRAGLRAVASRSHMSEETRQYLESLPVASLLSAGSSLKFCLLAEGRADVYPRLSPTMEWDTAAGDAILRAAGGIVLTTEGAPLAYGKRRENYRNPSFIAWGRPPEKAPAGK